MDNPIKNNKISFDYKNDRGNFEIEVIKKMEKREAYKDIRIKFSIDIKNKSNLKWKIKIADVRGRISKIEDKEKLVEMLKDEIKLCIDKDEQGDFYIGEPTLDLTYSRY